MPGRVTFEYEPREEHYSSLGAVHGGIVTAVLDTAMCAAMQSVLDADVGLATVELRTTFVRPVTLTTDVFRVEGTVVHAGSRLATAEARLVDRSRRPLRDRVLLGARAGRRAQARSLAAQMVA